MKEAVLSILLAALALGGFLYLSRDRERIRDRDEDDYAVEAPGQARPRSIESQMLDLAGARGEGLFTPQAAVVLLEGEQHAYPAILLWCGKFQAEGQGVFTFEDVRAVFNPEPKTLDELNGVARIDGSLDSGAVASRILEFLDEGRMGLRAGTAAFHGGRDLQSARRVLFGGGVELQIVDGRIPGGRATARTDTLELAAREGAPGLTVARSAGAVRIVSDAADLSGAGFELDLREGAFRFESNIEGTLRDVALLRLAGEPVRLRAGGPLAFRGGTPGDGPRGAAERGELTVGGGVVLAQGTESARGERLAIRSATGDGRIERVQLAGGAALDLDQGSFRGEMLQWERDEAGDSRIALAGEPILATLKEGARLLPGWNSREDLEIKTRGAAEFAHRPLQAGETREIVLPEPVELTAADARLAARRARMTLRNVAAARAEGAPAGSNLFPARIHLAGSVAGSSPAASFTAGELVYEREFDRFDVPVRDTLRLLGNPAFRWRGSAAAEEEEAPRDAPRLDGLLSAKSPVSVDAREVLSLAMDPLRIEPTVIEARGAAVARSLQGPDGESERSRVAGESLRIEFREEWRAVEDATGMAQRFVARRTVERADGRGDVLVVDDHGFRGWGDHLSYRAESGELRLAREEGAAAVEVRDRGGRLHRVEAPSIVWREADARVEGDGGVAGDVFLPPLGYGSGGRGAPVRTRIEAPRIVAALAAGEPGTRSGFELREILADAGMLLTQENGATLRCARLSADLEREEYFLQGSPFELTVSQREGDQDIPERLAGQALAIAAGRARVQGPLRATFHSRPKDLALALGSESRSQAATLPLYLEAEGDLAFTDRTLTVAGPARLWQGDPARDGFALRGNRFILALADRPGATGGERGPLKAMGALEVIHAFAGGDVRFESRDLTGEGDVMEFDLARNRISLYRYRDRGNALLTWRNQWQTPFPRFDLDLSVRENPIISTSRNVPAREER